MKFLRALTSTKPDAPFSVKALIYAILCTLLGTACLHCGIWIMGVVAALWFYTVAKARRKWLNLLIAVAVVILCFVPCWILVGEIHLYGEKLGQLILYGREHVYQRT